jgi:hypothetical protein
MTNSDDVVEAVVALRGEHPVGPDDQQRYSEVLEEMAVRLRGAREHLGCEPSVATVEYAALQLRKVLELILMASLVTNRAAIEEISQALAKADPDRARKLARKANPDYWPKSARVVRDNAFAPVPEDQVLAEGEWGRAFGRVSDLLHANNPYAPSIDLVAEHAALVEIECRLTGLLTKHFMVVAGANHMLMGQLSDDEVSVITMIRAAPG